MSQISEEDKKRAAIQLGLAYEQKPVNKEEIRREVKAIKEELASLKERLGTRHRPQTFVEAIQPSPIEMLKEDLQSLKEKVEGKKSTKKETLPSPPSEIILPSN